MRPGVVAGMLLLAVFSAAHAKPVIEFESASDDISHQIVVIQEGIEVNSGWESIASASDTAKSINGRDVTHHFDAFGSAHTIVLHTDEVLDSPVSLQHLGGKIAAAMPHVATTPYVLNLNYLDTSVENAPAYVAEGILLRGYLFQTYKTNKIAPFSINIVTAQSDKDEAYFESQREPVADGVYLARDLASEPGNIIYPDSFIDRVKAAMKGLDDIKIRILDKRDMQKLSMGALLGVGRGSKHDPALLIVEYKGGDKSDAPIALAGKGITFDTGGTSIKPNTNMWQMKSDMSGAAAVAGTMHAIARQQLPINVIGLMPLAENMPASDAIRPGDVLTTMQGTTIEIISTDAEGRLILSDAVRYAQEKYEPAMLLNIATLTGSAGRALSDEYAALITRDWDLSVEMKALGEQSGEHIWPLPLHPNHFKQITSEIADIKNSGAGSPGASIGAAVVGTFVDESLPWVHLDIAGVDWLNEPNDVAPVGAQGWGVRFMTQLVANQAQKGNQ